MALNADPQVLYQHTLRAIGSFLDQEEPVRFCILEVSDGFTAILTHGSGRPRLREMHFGVDALADRAEQLIHGRRMLGTKRGNAWALVNTGRQDFLRALGFELDDSKARSILIDELDDAVLVTYSFIDPGQGYQWRKFMATLQRDQIEVIVKDARDRRHRRGLLR